jgi:hypothetical protein
MNEAEIIAKLDELAECRKELAGIYEEQENARKVATPPEVHEALEAIAAEFERPISVASMVVDNLEAEIKAAILERQESVKGASLHAIWSKGRTTWETKQLEAYALSHPEILNFQKVDQPSVSIREAK